MPFMSAPAAKSTRERVLSSNGGVQRVSLVWRHMFLNLIVLVAPFQSRNQYMLRLVGGDAGKAAAWQSYMTAAASTTEFLINPALGRLSDQYGRKVFLLLSPLVNLVLKFLVFATDGRSFSLLALERIVGGAITTVGGSTTCSAAISDLVQGPDLAGALGTLGSYAGLGVLVAPFLSGQILATTGQVKHTYLFGAFVAGFQLIYNSLCFRETLQERKPMQWGACNPLSFVRIFTSDKTVAQLSLVAGLQCSAEGKCLADMNIAHLANTLKMSQQRQTVFVMLFGCSMIAAGRLPKLLIPQLLSQRDFTSFSNYMTIIALTIWGTASSIPVFWSGLAFLCPSMERRTATSAMATDLAVRSGFGKGEFAGAFANWRALCVAAAPLLYGAVYQKASQRIHGAAYLAAALITLFTELFFRSIPAENLSVAKTPAILSDSDHQSAKDVPAIPSDSDRQSSKDAARISLATLYAGAGASLAARNASKVAARMSLTILYAGASVPIAARNEAKDAARISLAGLYRSMGEAVKPPVPGLGSEFTLRPLEDGDLEKGLVELLAQLTDVGELGPQKFNEVLALRLSQPQSYRTLVIEHGPTRRIVGTATLLLERKFVRGGAFCGHVEDVVTDSTHRGKGLARALLTGLEAEARGAGCYKVVLDCKEHNVSLYSKFGYKEAEVQMRLDVPAAS